MPNDPCLACWTDSPDADHSCGFNALASPAVIAAREAGRD